MMIRRLASITAIAALALSACTSGGGGTTAAPTTAASASAPAASASGAAATDCTVAVSWNNYQQPRWAKNDQPNIKKTVEDGGGKYIEADANLSNEQQLTDITNLIGRAPRS
jgi:ABC-type xylose transport system substrate-binding protein